MRAAGAVRNGRRSSPVAGDKPAAALAGHGKRRVEFVKRSDRIAGFHILLRRCAVERISARLNCNRRFAKDFETTVAGREARIDLASDRLLACWLADPKANRVPV
jgi:transposase